MDDKNDGDKKLTNEVGAPVSDNEHVLTAGQRGPMMMQDLWFFEKMGHFNREVIPERRMHAKGSGAFGTFTSKRDVSEYTKAKVFENGKKTDVFVRFSTVAGERGAADAERDIRGFAVKFYTEEGNWDLVGNNTPVFFLRDPLKFPDLNHAIKRDPRTNMRSPQSNWDFWTLLPEAFHQITVVMSDRGIPASYRHMHGFGSHTFSLFNEKNERVWVKFHFKTQQGIKNLTDEEAAAIVSKDRESHQRDLYEAIERGDFPRWRMCFQIMTEEQALSRDMDPFDVTTVWSQKEYPLIEVGMLELNRNPDNYFAQVEQAAFSPAHIVPGIGLSPDKLLQGRLFSYADAQRYRLGVNHDQIPVNRSKAPVHAYHRDGLMRVDGNYGSTKGYQPNSYDEWADQNEYREPADKVYGDIYRYDPKDYPADDCFKQGGDLWRLIPEDEKAVLIKNTAADMATVTKNIRYRHATHCYLADPEYGERMSKALELDFETVKKYSKLDHEGLAKATK
ncbi:MAG: catalase [Candidatus Methanomethylophilaceae archaeon]|nr:catalase [Candidatus Methanomethylophilaceae archaeon]MDD2935681.1 catalase [Candidatus Methanomethylophilaceae archaeon]MDD3350982.1 catalase [Candidatus Methanomethylophilaceae archaeon]MDD3986416.1 catalase [Candidatus Methanomethylophilaceae archaeon]MDD4708568.1 catalase [Candidatus Methanomethylophilaceae archaeon]